MNLRGLYCLVMGTKRSGLAAVQLLLKQGAHVRAMDAQPLTPEERARFDGMGVLVVPQEAENLKDGGKEPDMIVLSPAVPYDLPLLTSARERGIPVIGEVELASHFLKGPVIGITGSNGKTTTTALTGHILKHCGIPCQVGGNIGTAVASMIDSSREDQWNVLELSSFQLESICEFRAEIAVCLNITPDHLDRHHAFENYVNAKARLFETQRAGDSAVLNDEDPVCRDLAGRTKADVYWFSPSLGSLTFPADKPGNRWTVPTLKLRGLHNVENAMAAALVARLAGAEVEGIGAAVQSFAGVEHRLEFVRELNGVEYFNDSKATNVDAALKAIDAFPGGLWIILGGKDKGSGYAPLRTPLAEKSKAVLLIGAAAPLIREALSGAVSILECGTLARAVEYAREHARAGDVVLLAPACASFDQFRDYEERGNVFKRLVNGAAA
ncbi:MAG: UDP-N-acetylmuramoyl-L-alanine--D-glutamate ligase [Bryobacteraceae bacterium]